MNAMLQNNLKSLSPINLSNKLDTRLDHLEIDQGFVVYERRKPA